MQDEKLITAKELAKNLEVPEMYIIELCENNLIQAKYNNNEWLIFKNRQLPCIKYLDLADNINQDDLNILKQRYSLVSLEELAYWPKELYYDDEVFGFEHICVCKGVFKDPSGKTHHKYILEIENFSHVAEWTDPLEDILYKVEDIIIFPSYTNFDAVFNSEAEAFKYAHLIYPELPLIECIKETRERILSHPDHPWNN